MNLNFSEFFRVLSKPYNIFTLVACLLLLIVSAACIAPENKVLSKEQVTQVVSQDSDVLHIIDNHTWKIFDVQLRESWSDSYHGKTPVQEIWLVPLFICYKDYEYIYYIEVSKEGKIYSIPDRPTHLMYEDVLNNSTDPCLSK